MGRSRLVTAGAVVVLGYVLAAVAAPLLAPHPPLAQSLDHRLEPPQPGHPLGLDQLGRDIASRLLFGARLSLLVGLVVVALGGSLGTAVGVLAGFAGGRIDHVLMRITDVFFAFPPLILAMAIAAALGPSLVNAMVAIALVTWPVYARLSRAQTLVLRRQEFVEAARAVGASDLRVITRHLLPNTLSPLIVQASFNMGEAILIAAGLSFIGFGAQPPTPEWGVMISEGRDYITTQWWVPTFPGLAILFAVTGFNLVGDGLRDLLDPRLRGR
ncbi:MAG: ABC transporter permease [Armatimonadota bacterium]|nr:ABC transporter permease [Armatimonadota bacterium]MDR7459749.1 ABC transporter permease [Armatimonadota bacterium]MDR7478593.1 ABC transporter permease [Armatimonadota bacterium]MDR7488429.1 ABC transporter permease [Armatimonadota bacterium]MDR7489907.1 ABC transporter permease [Armatimonadota bacterium]